MRLLFAIKSLAAAGGGAERVLCEVCSGLAERGHQVSIVSYDPPGAPSFYPLDSRVRRLALPIGKAAESTSLSETLARLPALRRLAREERPDAAIGFMHSIYVPMALALAGTGVPLLASEHIVYRHFESRPLERLLLNLVPPLLAGITTISAAARATFPRRIAERTTVIPNPVSVDPAARADPVGGARKTLLSVGRLEEQKDHRTLIAAFARIAGEFPDWDLRIVGEGSLRAPLEAQVQAAELTDRVAMPGTMADIADEYGTAQLFAMPSTYESFGLATAEALAHGLPAIGFADCPGTNELIRSGENGLLVEGPDRPLALAQGLREAMKSPALCAEWAKAAPQSVSMYRLADVLNAWEELLRRIAARQGVS
jgi:glycosyltransferase involved in cell wall biosynthesis